MLHHADVQLLSHARARGERFRAESVERARVDAHLDAGFRGIRAGSLVRLARRLASITAGLAPRIARPSWQPRA